jgi:hypothetical protein
MGQIFPYWASSKPREQISPCPRLIRGLPQGGLGAPLIRPRPQPLGVSDIGRSSTVLPPRLSPEMALPISDSSEANLRRHSLIGALETSHDVAHVLVPI